MCSYVHVDTKPTYAKLALLRVTGGTNIKIIDRMADIWEDVCTQLDFDEDGTQLSIIDREHHGDLKACCRAMFKHWLNGNGLPCTWRTLVELLRDLDKITLAEEIESALLA